VIPELIETKIQNYIWFRNYGFSSMVFNNNCENLIVISFLLLKILLLKQALKLIDLKFKNKIKIKTNFVAVILV
jgi:hypothetical protein